MNVVFSKLALGQLDEILPILPNSARRAQSAWRLESAKLLS
jgi:hypothetical protein